MLAENRRGWADRSRDAAVLGDARATEPPDRWGERAAAEWVHKLSAGERFSGTTEGLLETAHALDRLYGRSTPNPE